MTKDQLQAALMQWISDEEYQEFLADVEEANLYFESERAK